MRHPCLLAAAFLVIGLPSLGSAGSIETQIQICLEGSLERNIDINGASLADELDFCLSSPGALEDATIAKTLPTCHGDASEIAACLVERALG